MDPWLCKNTQYLCIYIHKANTSIAMYVSNFCYNSAGGYNIHMQWFSHDTECAYIVHACMHVSLIEISQENVHKWSKALRLA